MRTRITLSILSGLWLLCAVTPAAMAKVDALNAPAALAACGDPNASFIITKAPGTTPSTHAPADKALVFVFADFPKLSVMQTLLAIGADSKWVGATHQKSYMSFLIPPGLHHLCVSFQNARGFNFQHGIELDRLNAVAGKTYYFRVGITAGGVGIYGRTLLQAVNEDEGQLLVQTSTYTTSKEK